jgi:DNA recombination protein RmuC
MSIGYISFSKHGHSFSHQVTFLVIRYLYPVNFSRMSPLLLITAVVSLLAGAGMAWLVVNSRKTVSDKLLAAALAEKTMLEASYKITLAELQKALNEIATLNAQLHYKDEKLELQKQEVENIGNKFENQFKLLANNILEEKAQKFTEQQETNLKTILEPLRQNIQTFKQEFETRYTDETKERSSLQGQIKAMMELNKTLSDQANSLTQALRGQVKQQGNWGEMILESILEYCGLQKNIQYFVQQSSQNAEGKTIQPDVIVKYPDERAIVIDSKVSLVHYESFSNAANIEEQQQWSNLLVKSLKAHIDGLSGKSYHDVKHALDFVIMFVPLEAAYITAMQADTALWQYAYNKRILLISPTNLVAAMKLVSDMWQRDAINRDAHRIAEKAGKLYEKLVGFVDNFERVGQQLEKANSTWNDAYKQLSKGKGNIISKAEEIKGLKANTQKSLPQSLVDEAMAENGNDEE